MICDADGFGFKQLRHFTIQHARSATSFVQDSFPLWFRSIHVVNSSRLFYVVSSTEVHIFRKDHKILQNLHLTFDYSIYSQKLGEDFAKFCGLLRIYEL